MADPRRGPPIVAGFEGERLRDEVRGRLFGRNDPGPHIGEYRVLRKLGQGAMGEVYLATAPEDGRQVAIKVVASAGANAELRLRREARALLALHHPHIVRVFEVGEFAHGVFVVMEYIDGTTLRARLDDDNDRRSRLSLLLPVGEALVAAHALGILHRDVKPDNVLVSTAGVVKLVDFGLVKPAAGSEAALLTDMGGQLTRTGTALGTIGYAAPEQLLGKPVDHRADQFALCVTMWEAIFGVLPHRGATADAIGLAALAGRIETPRAHDVAEPLLASIRRGLAPEPARRHHDVAALLTAVRQSI